MNSITGILMSVVLVLVAITIHELAHGYAAYKLGDPTAKSQGRLTLNPLAHLDPIGALLMLVVGFGWAKPVPVNPFYFKGDRQKGMMIVSFAGPLANLLLAVVLAAVLNLTFNGQYTLLTNILLQGMSLNVMLAVFNLIPIPPLDGSKILAGLLPKDISYRYMRVLDQYGFIILFALIIFNVTDMFLQPIIQFVLNGLIMLTSFLG